MIKFTQSGLLGLGLAIFNEAALANLANRGIVVDRVFVVGSKFIQLQFVRCALGKAMEWERFQ